jgi:hypothetical protein
LTDNDGRTALRRVIYTVSAGDATKLKVKLRIFGMLRLGFEHAAASYPGEGTG